jgi:hypothetical protein
MVYGLKGDRLSIACQLCQGNSLVNPSKSFLVLIALPYECDGSNGAILKNYFLDNLLPFRKNKTISFEYKQFQI